MPTDTRTWSLATTDAVSDGISPSGSLTGIVTLELSGTWTGTVTFQATIGHPTGGTANWYSVEAVPSTSTTAATTATGNGLYRIDAGGYALVRAKFTTASSGTVVVYAYVAIG